MGVMTEMRFVFAKEKHARWARRIVEGIIKADYARRSPLADELDCMRSLMSTYFFNEELLAGYDLIGAHPDCALRWVERRGTILYVDRCADVQATFALTPDALDEEPFPQICLAYALRFPQVRFAAYCQHEQTTSGALQLTRASWDGFRMRLRRRDGERPMAMDDWDTWQLLDLYFVDGEFMSHEDDSSPLERHFRALLDEAKEARAAGDAVGALHFADAALALPGCGDAVEAVAFRGLAGRHLARHGVRRVLPVWTRQVPADVQERLGSGEGVNEVVLAEGRYVARLSEGAGPAFQVVDTRDVSVVAESEGGWGDGLLHVVDDCWVVAQGRFFLIDWDFGV